MKILKIFGLVVGVHVLAFMFVFAIPGCRSTRRHSPSALAPASEASPMSAPAAAPSSDYSSSPISSGASSSSNSNVSQAMNPVSAPSSAAAMPTVSFPGASSGSRANPTRPGVSAGAAQNGALGENTASSNYTVEHGDNLWKIAKKNNVSVAELAAVNHLKSDSALRPGQKLTIPGRATPSSAVAPATASTVTSNEPVTYEVRSGDTLAVIAKRVGTTTATLRTMNRLKNDNLRPGQKLKVPNSPNATAAAAAAAATPPAGSSSEAASSVAATTQRPTANSGKHLVKQNETLSQIARKYGVSRADIATANNITDPRTIHAGQELIIPSPKNGKAAPATATTEQPPAQPEPTINQPVINTAPTSPISSPISAPTEASPISPAASETTPPVIKVEETNPIAPPKS